VTVARTSLIVLTLMATAWCMPARAQGAQGTTSPQSLIEKLGDADPALREAAMQTLWERGQSAVSALEVASRSPNPEVAARANLVLGRIRLGIGPRASVELVRLVVQARQAPSPPERAAARQRLAAAPSDAAPAIARLLADALHSPDQSQDPVDQVVRELWPVDQWALARTSDELARLDDGQALLDWLERGAAAGVSPLAAPNFAYAVRARGDLEESIQRWRQRVTAEPSAEHRRVLACLLFAAGDVEARQHLPPDASGALLPIAWALLDGDEQGAAERAGEHPDELERLAVGVLLARIEDDEKRDFAATTRIRQWLKDHAEELGRAARTGVEREEMPPAPGDGTPVDHAIVAAMLAGDLPSAFALALELDAPGLVRLHYRRLDFDAGAQVVARHTQRPSEQSRAVQITQRRMREELEMRVQRGQPAPELSNYARRRMGALDALRRNDASEAAQLLGELVLVDGSDPATRWSWGYALLSAGEQQAGTEQLERAQFMPLANPWLRRELAKEMLLCGRREEALHEFAEAARWGTLIPEEALPAMESLGDELSRSGRHREAARAQAAALLMLLAPEVYEPLTDRALYFAFYLASELERSRMNRAADKGDWQKAQAALARSLAYLPQSESAIDLINALDAAGQKATADRIFIEVFTPLSTALRRYPQSSLLNNQAAWLAASCTRRLDTALSLAQNAVACDPSSPAALDTLAEVAVRRGQPQVALELLERVLAAAELRETASSASAGLLSDYLARREQFLRRIPEASE
jgi:tetratricopeptide (TPR) repeat protein